MLKFNPAVFCLKMLKIQISWLNLEANWFGSTLVSHSDNIVQNWMVRIVHENIQHDKG